MNMYDYRKYIWSIERIEARENLLQLEMNDYPHVGQEARTRIFEKYDKVARPEFYNKRSRPEEIKKFLSGG